MTQNTSSITFKEASNEISVFLDDITFKLGGYYTTCANKNFLLAGNPSMNEFLLDFSGAKILFNVNVN